MEPAAPMFHLLIFGTVSLKTVVLLIGEISLPLETVLFSRGSQLLPRESTFHVEVYFPPGSQIFPRESKFPKGVNFSRGSQLFPRESTFPGEVKFSRGKSNFPGSQLFREVKISG